MSFLFESYCVVLGCVGFVLVNPCMVFQRVCVMCLSRYFLHMAGLYVISENNSEIEGSDASCALMLFMCSILRLMCSGSSLHVECILPFGMLCLSAW